MTPGFVKLLVHDFLMSEDGRSSRRRSAISTAGEVDSLGKASPAGSVGVVGAVQHVVQTPIRGW